ncbi:hypothetical protein BDI4_210002 [Burkholderia diffusa]|nr:hypothetical protein BDI4_210002 [Burkholderia diffusa]
MLDGLAAEYVHRRRLRGLLHVLQHLASRTRETGIGLVESLTHILPPLECRRGTIPTQRPFAGRY